MALVPVRQGRLPAGAEEVVAEAGGRALLAGEGTEEAAGGLATARWLALAELGPFAPAAWSTALARLMREAEPAEDLALLPASPDGRDLAPRLAHELGWPLVAGAVLAQPGKVLASRYGGGVLHEYRPPGPAVVTLEPGCRGTEPQAKALAKPECHAITLNLMVMPDPQGLGVVEPGPGSVELAEAELVAAGGAGLGTAGAMERLFRVAGTLGAAVGATRAATDAGWAGPQAQIGTTGVSIHPRAYLAFGISGAAQHVAGIGRPEHVVAVNTDPSCPMMGLADLAVLADAPAVLDALATLLGVPLG